VVVKRIHTLAAYSLRVLEALLAVHTPVVIAAALLGHLISLAAAAVQRVTPAMVVMAL
jgi:type III secretory pathway component EscS